MEKNATLEQINHPLFQLHNIKVSIKRDDLIHPIISGNKWRKLKYSLDHALLLGSDTLISMGGAYSNHLHALAYTGKILGLKTKGFIRGQIVPISLQARVGTLPAFLCTIEKIASK